MVGTRVSFEGGLVFLEDPVSFTNAKQRSEVTRRDRSYADHVSVDTLWHIDPEAVSCTWKQPEG